MVQGHGMVLALHLMKLLKSSRRFTDLMTKKFDALKNISCLKSIHLQLQVGVVKGVAMGLVEYSSCAADSPGIEATPLLVPATRSRGGAEFPL